LNILIVDDEPMLRELVCQFIDDVSLPVQYVEASSADEAIRLLSDESNVFSMIVCDYNMPGGNGLAVLEHWQHRQNFIPFILYSSEADEVRVAYKKKNSDQHERLQFVNKNNGIEDFQFSLLTLWRNGFSQMPVKYFRPNLVLKSNLYLRISEKKIIKVFNEGESIDTEKIEAYKKRGLANLFISHPDYLALKCLPHDFPVFESRTGETGLSHALELFKNSFQSILETKILNADNLSITFSYLEAELNEVLNENVFNFISTIDFNDKNYVINHSLLLFLLSSQMLKDLGRDTKPVRQSLFRACILHDILIDNDRAWKRDLFPKLLSEKESNLIFLNEQRILEKIQGLGLSQDSLAIFNALKSSLYEEDFIVVGDHKIAKLVALTHQVCNNLYQNEFCQKLDEGFVDSLFKDDDELFKSARKLFVF